MWDYYKINNLHIYGLVSALLTQVHIFLKSLVSVNQVFIECLYYLKTYKKRL